MAFMGEETAKTAAKKSQLAAGTMRQRIAARRLSPLSALMRAIRSALANELSLRMLKLAHGRSAFWRTTIGAIVGAAWLVLGGGAALDYAGLALRDSTAAEASIKDNPDWNAGIDAPIRAFANSVCVLRQGKVCEYDKAESRVVAGQVALTLLALVTVFFGFWRQLLAAMAKVVRYMGARHVIITGTGPQADALARAVARNSAEWRRRATILVRSEASSAEIESLGSDGVAVVVGDTTNTKLLQSCGAGSAYRIIAMSDSEAENFATANALYDIRGVGQGDVALRIENHELRRDLPRQRAISAADLFSLPDIAARRFTRDTALFEDAINRASGGVHLAVIGWDAYSQAAVEHVFRMMWAPDFAPPKVTVFCPTPDAAEAEFNARFPKTRGAVAVWSADIDFRPYEWRQEEDPWTPMREVEKSRGVISSVLISYPDDGETLHCAAVIAKRAAPDHVILYVRDDVRGANAAVLRAFANDRLYAFASRTRVLSPESIVDRSLDEAAFYIHEDYVRASVLRQNPEDYVKALKHSQTPFGKIAALLNRAGDETSAIPDLENQFRDKRGDAALKKLQARIAEKLIIKGEFAPQTEGQNLWEDLPATYVDASRAAADHAALKLRALGWRPTRRGGKKTPPRIEPNSITVAMAESEHMRWCADKILDGWVLGDRDDQKLTHPDLKLYAAFDDSKRLTAIEKDKANWLNAAEVASLTFPAGFVRVDG